MLTGLIQTLRSTTPTFSYVSLIKRLDLSHLQNVIVDEQFVEFDVCTSVERLALGRAKQITSEAMCRVLGQMGKLVVLSLSGVSKVNDKVLTTIAKSCKKLEGLDLTDCNAITDLGMLQVADSCRSLRKVGLFRFSLYSMRLSVQTLLILVDRALVCRYVSRIVLA